MFKKEKVKEIERLGQKIWDLRSRCNKLERDGYYVILHSDYDAYSTNPQYDKLSLQAVIDLLLKHLNIKIEYHHTDEKEEYRIATIKRKKNIKKKVKKGGK